MKATKSVNTKSKSKPKGGPRKKKSTTPGGKPKSNKITTIGKGLRDLGGLAGSMFGMGPFGRQVGATVSRIFGQGDYMCNSVSRNSLVSPGGPPSFSPLTSGFRIKHREYIRDISSSTAFNSYTFKINPGLPELFPWLSSVAPNFEEYKIHGMVVYLNTTSATAVSSTNTALGIWGAVTQYDPSDPAFTTKQQCENYVGCQTAVPSQSLMHGIECVPQSNVLDQHYVRTGALSSNQDIKFYDWGTLQVFTQGSQAVATIGEMWVSYDIEFKKPRLPTGGYVSFTDRYYITGATTANNLGTADGVLPYNGSNVGTTITGTTSVINVPASAPDGIYLLSLKYDMSTSTTPFTAPGVTPSGSMILGPNLFTGNSAILTYAPQAAVAANRWGLFQIYLTKNGGTSATLTVSGGVISGVAAIDVILTRISSGFLASSTQQPILESNEIKALKKLLAKLGIEPDEEPDVRFIGDDIIIRQRDPSNSFNMD